jgi:hypothetical protein
MKKIEYNYLKLKKYSIKRERVDKECVIYSMN